MNTQQLVERLQRIASGGGGWVLWLMIGLSIVSLGIMLERLIYFARRRDDIDRLTAEMQKALQRGDTQKLKAVLSESRAIEASVILRCVDWVDRGPEAFRDVLDAELGKERRELERGTTYLGTLGNNAPFVGLVGTVLGVIQAFQQLGNQSKDAMGNVMVGIAEALIATGVGLVVALPAVVAFNLVNKSIGRVEANVDIMAKYIEAHLRGTLHAKSSVPEVQRVALVHPSPASSVTEAS
ncbi:MotA/TolQ/ExbB proton channel family protein [Pendulispora albinea]|uniref:MotA/TolQ/ExbB proton channel family protein n=1 Tax=Pendulispora albinea TaxID=2741071 RepID=A0ABZ2LJJ7_9BACT